MNPSSTQIYPLPEDNPATFNGSRLSIFILKLATIHENLPPELAARTHVYGTQTLRVCTDSQTMVDSIAHSRNTNVINRLRETNITMLTAESLLNLKKELLSILGSTFP